MVQISKCVKTTKEKMLFLVKQAENITDLDILDFIQKSFWIIMAQVGAGFFAFITTVAISNTLPKEVFGEYRFYLSLLPIFVIFSLPGVSTAVTRSVAKNKRLDLFALSRIRVKYGFFGSFLAFLAGIYYSFIYINHTLALAFFIIAILVPFFDSFSITIALLKGKENFKLSSIYEIIIAALTALLVILSAIVSRDALIIFLLYIITQILVYLILLKKYKLMPNMMIEPTDTYEAASFGKQLFFVDALGVFGSNADKLLIWYFLGSQAVAIYIIAITLPLFINRAFSFVPQVLLPKLSRVNYYNKNQIRAIIKRTAYFFLFLCLIPLFYIPISPYIFNLLFNKYTDALYLSQIMSIVIVFQIISAVLWSILTAQKQSGVMLFISFLSILMPSLSFMLFYNSLGIMALIFGLAIYQVLAVSIELLTIFIRNRLI